MGSKLANTNDIPDNSPLCVTASDGREIALFKIDGEVCALNNCCPHKGGPLGKGDVEEGCVVCPWHGWEFDIRTGECQNMPGQDATKIAVQVRNGEVYEA